MADPHISGPTFEMPRVALGMENGEDDKAVGFRKEVQWQGLGDFEQILVHGLNLPKSTGYGKVSCVAVIELDDFAHTRMPWTTSP